MRNRKQETKELLARGSRCLGWLFVAVLLTVGMTGCNLSPTAPNSIMPSFNFSIQSDGRTVVFNNSTQGVQRWSWAFGNGQQSTERSPIHQYSSGGSYQVSLEACPLTGSAPCGTVTNLVVLKK